MALLYNDISLTQPAAYSGAAGACLVVISALHQSYRSSPITAAVRSKDVPQTNSFALIATGIVSSLRRPLRAIKANINPILTPPSVGIHGQTADQAEADEYAQDTNEMEQLLQHLVRFFFNFQIGNT